MHRPLSLPPKSSDADSTMSRSESNSESRPGQISLFPTADAGGDVSPFRSSPRSVYVHVPFCLHRCGYCDFTLVADRDHLIPDYLKALENELATLPSQQNVETIFIGGGTPTHLSPDQLNRLCELIARCFRLTPGGEYSIEANPDGLSDEHLRILTSHGVNRLSLGVQSFDDHCLITLERKHTAAEAVETIRRCGEFFGNLSIDLIFGVPGQSIESWQQSLTVATSQPVTHISTYGLTYETGTSFFRNERRGLMSRVPEESERRMYLAAIEHLGSRGFEHYEVSSFAKPGCRCRHNQTYWQADEYFAFGPGAARYQNGIRSTNSRSVVGWMKSWLERRPCEIDVEQLNQEDRAREALMLALRMIDGVDLKAFEARFGVSAPALAGPALQRHVSAGLLRIDGSRLQFTQEGLLLADSVVVDFL